MQTKILRHKYYELLKADFTSFIGKSFITVNPGTKFLYNWHIELISEILQEVAQGKIKRLVINMPPRYLKSLCVSVAWPAWLLGHNPTQRIMVASYSQLLSNKHSLDCRIVMLSKWYRELFPETILRYDQNTKYKFATNHGGFRFATSINGTNTGEGGNVLIVDDPHNFMHINSIKQRNKVIEWFEQGFISRLDDKNTGSIVLVMQRFHENDLAGYLLKKNSCSRYYLKIPAITHQKTYISVGKLNIIREEGSILHTKREDKIQLNIIKNELGEYSFAAQYQQMPINTMGNMIKAEWIKRYKEIPIGGKIIQSWDTAIKAGRNNNYTVCSTWMLDKNNYYLIDICRVRVEYPDLKKLVEALAGRWKAELILIEDKASGQSLLQDFKREGKLPLMAIRPVGDKITRFASCSIMFELGRVFLPLESKWLTELEYELLSFPITNYDDQIDSISQFLSYIKNHIYNGTKFKIRML
ncbi:Transposase [Rickettsiales bacterium Ac37b]|nr:Transposase [Rickettsiales bacterium Ac37b]